MPSVILVSLHVYLGYGRLTGPCTVNCLICSLNAPEEGTVFTLSNYADSCHFPFKLLGWIYRTGIYIWYLQCIYLSYAWLKLQDGLLSCSSDMLYTVDHSELFQAPQVSLSHDLSPLIKISEPLPFSSQGIPQSPCTETYSCVLHLCCIQNRTERCCTEAPSVLHNKATFSLYVKLLGNILPYVEYYLNGPLGPR